MIGSFLLAKQLVPKKVQVHRGGKVFERTQMVRPEDVVSSLKAQVNKLRTDYDKAGDIYSDVSYAYDKAKDAGKMTPEIRDARDRARRMYYKTQHDYEKAQEKLDSLIPRLRGHATE